ncbi:MAG: hypothetical protein HYX97_05955 [Chloroflexi bacterium]|nr:hypothetical protein [Chloroflexota bacterium]
MANISKTPEPQPPARDVTGLQQTLSPPPGQPTAASRSQMWALLALVPTAFIIGLNVTLPALGIQVPPFQKAHIRPDVVGVLLSLVGFRCVMLALSQGEYRGVGAGTFNMLRNLGGNIGVATTGTVLAVRLASYADTAAGRADAYRDAFLFTGLMIALAAVAALFVRERVRANTSRGAT